MQIQQLFEIFSPLFQQVSQQILQIYHDRERQQIHLKSDLTPVTLADIVANQIIENFLQQFTPEIPVMSEESSLKGFSERQQWSKLWLVDPLDGTRGFIEGNDEFTINIALIKNHVPIWGMIHLPVENITYIGIQGEGACCYQANGERFSLRVNARCHTPPILLMSRHTRPSSLMRDFQQFLREYQPLYRSSALKFGWVAQGLADMYARLGSTWEWDTAAGQCIVEAAGGHVIDTKLQPLRYNTRETLLNPPFLVSGEDLSLIKAWSKNL